ncbi:MAG TPA: DsbA family protein, partial [Novosphingobium sp.]|nr:DsbA family protein [Novosphingobium sp.]
MSATDRKPAGRLAFIALGLGLMLLGALGGWLWESQRAGPAAGMASRDRAAVEQVVREYILANPEVLPEAMENLQQKANRKQLAAVGDDLEKPFPGAVMGNPAGKVVVVSC